MADVSTVTFWREDVTGFVGVKLLLSEVFSKWKRKWKGSGKENKEIKRDRKEEKKEK